MAIKTGISADEDNDDQYVVPVNHEKSNFKDVIEWSTKTNNFIESKADYIIYENKNIHLF